MAQIPYAIFFLLHFNEIIAKKGCLLNETAFQKDISFNYPPKSSKDTFSGGTPQSSTIFKTAAFIMGGPQK